MTQVPLYMIFAVFLASAMLFAAVWVFVSWWLERGRRRVAARIRPTEDSEPVLLLDSMYADGASGTGRYGWWADFHRSVAERLERTELGLSPFEAFSLILFCGVVPAAAVFFWRYEHEESWMAIPAFFLGAAIPFFYFLFRQRAWQRRMQDQLPDMLFLLARSLRAGMSMDQSIRALGDHGVAPLSREFARMHRQLELGLALPQVLKITADRVQLVDFSVFASVLSLHRATGGNLAILMDRLAQTTRDHNQLRGYYRTATALSRASNIAILITTTLLISYLCFFHRDLAAHYFETTAGMTLFGIGVGLILGAATLMYLLTRETDL